MVTNNEMRFRATGQIDAAKTERNSGKGKTHKIYGTFHLVGICALIAALVFAVYTCDASLPKSKPIDALSTEFSGDRARKHLEAIANIGPRPTGSYASDNLTVDYLLKELNLIKEKADPQFHIEVELQRASGSFAFFRKQTKFVESFGLTSTYDNTSNVIVKISASKSTKYFVLANAHFDTVMNTEGASDDTVNCAVLIENFRAISKLHPKELKHGVIFLFNGGEEGGFSGSHAFLQHKWFPLVKVVVNMEAAGSGGREFVFQTGPGHPWILDMYASTAKYPFTSVLAQEIFHAGLVPSDTDFRIFVQYGNLVGVDIAFVKNGYVYHTRYDVAKSIPSGSIQRAGENLHGLIKGIANSEYLENPEKYKHGSSVFFDVIGLFVVHYPKRLQLLMNRITCVVVALYILQHLYRRKFSSGREHVGSRNLTNSTVSLTSLLLATVTILFSWILAFAVPVGVALVLIKLKVLMTWYSYPLFSLFLYGLPALFGMLLGHFIGNELIKKISYTSIQSFVFGHVTIYSTILFCVNQYEISSSFIIWFWIIFPFLFLCVVLDNVTFLPEKKDLATYLLHIVAVTPPALISIYHLDMLYLFFGPLFGRTGSIIPTDIIIAILSGFCIVLVFTYFMDLYHSAVDMKRMLFIVGFFSLVPFLYVLTGRLQPYSGRNPITPKRIYLTHMLRKFHNSDGSLQRQDSGIWIQPMDALAFRPLENIDYFKKAEDFKCDGSYCGLPYYYAKRIIMRQQWYLRGEKPEGITDDALSTDIYKRVEQPDGSITFYFDIPGPDHMLLFLTLKPGVVLDWSMYKNEDDHIYKMNDYNGGFTYVVFYTHGYQHKTWKFWMQFKKSTSHSTLAQLGIAQHHLHGKNSRTRLLNATINALPDWVHDNSWCSNYDSFILE